MELSEVIQNECWVIRGLLSPEERQSIMETGMKNGIQENVAAGDRRHRNNCKHALDDSSLAETLWGRIKGVVPQRFDIEDPTSPPTGFKPDSARHMQGLWRPHGVNRFFTLLYYHSGGHFGPHRDSCVVTSDHDRSVLTMAMYLNNRPSDHGGATNFLRDDMDCPAVDDQGRIRSPEDAIVAQVKSDEAGKAVLFMHDLMHEGESLEVRREDGSVDQDAQAEPKWLLITQVMYQRDVSSAPQLSPEQQEARSLLHDAEEAEVKGEIQAAIRLYNRAYRLDPSLEFG